MNIRWDGFALTLLRVVAGFTYSLHGWQKAFGAFGGFMGHPGHASGIFLVAGWIELIAGTLILLGLFTRPAAFLASGEMAVAYFMVHAPRGFWPIKNGGELAVVYCFVFLFLVAAGAGEWSLDAMLRRRP